MERKEMTAEKPKKFILEGHGYQEKVVKPHSAYASMIYLPANWTGKKVACILLEQ